MPSQKIKHYHFIINPAAKHFTGHQWFKRLEDRFFKGVIPYSVHVPTSLNSLIQVVTEVSEKNAAVIAVGGDGTVNAVATGLVRSDHPAILGVIPLGTGNALAYSLGVRSLNKAAQAILTGKVYQLDLIETNNSVFPFSLFMASVGWDSRVLAVRHKCIHWGHFGSFPIAIMKSAGLPLSKITLKIDQNMVMTDKEVSTVLINNGHCYGFGFKAVPNNFLDDGKLEIQVFPNKTVQTKTLLKYNLGKNDYSSDIMHFSGTDVEVWGDPHGQIDGELIQQEHLKLKIKPHALRVIALKKEFFSKDPIFEIN